MMDMVPQAQIDTYRARCVISKNQSKFVYYLTYSYCMFNVCCLEFTAVHPAAD